MNDLADIFARRNRRYGLYLFSFLAFSTGKARCAATGGAISPVAVAGVGAGNESSRPSEMAAAASVNDSGTGERHRHQCALGFLHEGETSVGLAPVD